MSYLLLAPQKCCKRAGLGCASAMCPGLGQDATDASASDPWANVPGGDLTSLMTPLPYDPTAALAAASIAPPAIAAPISSAAQGSSLTQTILESIPSLTQAGVSLATTVQGRPATGAPLPTSASQPVVAAPATQSWFQQHEKTILIAGGATFGLLVLLASARKARRNPAEMLIFGNPARWLRNIAAGFHDEDGVFHPIRASYDYSRKRAGESSRRKPRRKGRKR